MCVVQNPTALHDFKRLIEVSTAQSSYANAVLVIVILSVRQSVCHEMKEHTADILIPHERAIALVI